MYQAENRDEEHLVLALLQLMLCWGCHTTEKLFRVVRQRRGGVPVCFGGIESMEEGLLNLSRKGDA